ncbi:MAG: amphi-Trp domain-containing protein [Ketobacter sp.]|nr:MAG: amphi-Trp domain-containing protein [Ketobacter sp.]
MRQNRNSFRHESLQDRKSIQEMLKSITKGIAKGELTFSDEDGEIQLEPQGLLQFKVTAKQDESRHRLDIKISWAVDDEEVEEKPLSVVAGPGKKSR